MVLMVGYYRERSTERAAELAECLRRNCENACIEEVHVFLEDDSRPQLGIPKIRFIPLGRRLLYKDLFEHAQRELIGRGVILANSDIYFDHTLSRVDDTRGDMARNHHPLGTNVVADAPPYSPRTSARLTPPTATVAKNS